ncbi:MAG: tyrosine-type recombinase/integrase [Labedaea sp.]
MSPAGSPSTSGPSRTACANWTWHDLRHTAAVRMSRDRRLSLRDVQTILGHDHASTTAEVYLAVEEAGVIGRVAALPAITPMTSSSRGRVRRGFGEPVTLALFNAFGSAKKALHANMGGRIGVPQFEGDSGNRFFARHPR